MNGYTFRVSISSVFCLLEEQILSFKNWPQKHTGIHASSFNKTCNRDRTARLTAPCPSHKKLYRKTLTFANAATANADAGGSTTALPGLCPDELTMFLEKRRGGGGVCAFIRINMTLYTKPWIWNLGHFWYNTVIESTALSNLRNYNMFIFGFHHQIMSGSLMRLK